MIRLLLCLLTVLAAAPSARLASAQASTPAGTAGGLPVLDAANLIRLVVDVTLQRVRQRVLEGASQKATTHYRRVSQYAGVDVFRAGAARAALTSSPPQHHRTRYTEVYRPGYAPGVPEAEQDSLSIARIDSVTLSHARELELLRRDIVQLNAQIVELDRELQRRLTSRAPRWGNNTPNPQGDLEQLQAALKAKRAALAARHARVTAIQTRQDVVMLLYGRQDAARYSFKVQRGAQEYVPSPLPAPFVPDPRYGGVRNFLRFPGLPQGAAGN